MRIAVVSISTPSIGTPTGADRVPAHVDGLVTALTAGHDVVVHPAALGEEGALADELPRLADALVRTWRAERPDVVHAQASVAGLAAGAAARELDLPLVLSLPDVHGDPGAATAAVARRADRVLVASAHQARGLVRAGVPRAIIRVVPPGVDADALTPEGAVLDRGVDPRLVAVGGIGPGSGIEDVLSALRLVPAVQLVVAAGTGTWTAADARRCRRRVDAAGVADRVRLVGGVGSGDAGPLLRSADLVVHVPREPAAGLPVLSAMACGRPVIASTVGVLPDLVVDQVTGVLVSPGRPGELGRAVARLLAQPSMPVAFGIAGRDRVLARFSWERIGATVSDVLHELLSERRGAPTR